MDNWEMKYANSVLSNLKKKRRRVILRSYIMTKKETILKALFSYSRLSSFLFLSSCSVKKDIFFPCAWLLSQSMCHLKMKRHLCIYSSPTLCLISIVRVTFFCSQVKNRNSTFKKWKFSILTIESRWILILMICSTF